MRTSAVLHLSQAIEKVALWDPPMRFNDTTRTYFEKLATIGTPEEAERYNGLFNPSKAAASREYLAELRVSVPVTALAKWKTFLQLVAVGFLIAGEAGDQILPVTTLTGVVLLWLSAILTLYTGWDYFRAGVRHLIDD